MLVVRKDYLNEDGSLGWVESVFASGNILKSTYFPHKERMYLSFSRGHTYSYGNISQELYNEFEEVESQGEYFAKNIAKNDKYPATKEFTLYPYEIEEVRGMIIEHKNKLKK